MSAVLERSSSDLSLLVAENKNPKLQNRPFVSYKEKKRTRISGFVLGHVHFIVWIDFLNMQPFVMSKSHLAKIS